MHFVISGTWGPTDPTRAMLPFIFAASAVQDGDTVTLMLFHDAVLMGVDGAGAKLVPVGPPNRYGLGCCRKCHSRTVPVRVGSIHDRGGRLRH